MDEVSYDIILSEEEIDYYFDEIYTKFKDDLIYYQKLYTAVANFKYFDFLAKKITSQNKENNLKKSLIKESSKIETYHTSLLKDEISNEYLINELSSLLKNYSPFEVTFKGVYLSDNKYVLLKCIKENSILISLHNDIYKKSIPNHFKESIYYIPYIILDKLII